MGGWFFEACSVMINFRTKAMNSIAQGTNLIAKVTNSFANRMNSIAKAMDSIAKTCNSVLAASVSSIANMHMLNHSLIIVSPHIALFLFLFRPM